MRNFTGLEYLYIDIANQYGLDKENWDTRIQWTKDNEPDLENQVHLADDPVLYTKAVKVLRDTQAGKWTGFIMGLDATASGYQIMSAVIGDAVGASNVNLLDTGKREDIYSKIAAYMNLNYGTNVDRKTVKKPIMTVGYGSQRQPAEIFGEDTPELEAFYDAMNAELPGGMTLMADMLNCRDRYNATEYRWTLPDGHKVVSKIMVLDHEEIELNDMDSTKFHYSSYVNKPDPNNMSLAANIVHSIDGYIVREMLRRTRAQKVQMAAIHDSFWSHPNDMNHIRRNYIEIMAELADSNVMRDIFREVTNNPKLGFSKYSNTLGNAIRQSEYALS